MSIHRDPEAWARDLREQLGELIADLNSPEPGDGLPTTLIAIDRLTAETADHLTALRAAIDARRRQGSLL